MNLEDQPLLAHFSRAFKSLTRDEAQTADFDTRLASIGRLLVRDVLRMHRRLSPEGRLNYEPEDLFLEIWAELRKRNEKYDKRKGNYRTFAMRIARNKFSELRIRSRCVKLPSDADKQFRCGQPDQVGRLARTATDHEPLCDVLVQDRQPSPVDGLIWLESHEAAVSDVAKHIGNMSVHEAIAISTLGVWGPKKPIVELSRQYGIQPSVLRKALASARAKLESK